MSEYEKKLIDGKTIWVTKEQAPIAVPVNTPKKPGSKLQVRVGKQYGERKNWW